MSSMEDANGGAEDSSEKMARFSKKNESVTLQIKGEKEKGSVPKSEKTQSNSNI